MENKTTVKRLVKDITEIYKNPLNDNGVYYIHDDENMLKGYALIIGPENTIYQYGYYFFEFTFPENYPFQPPKVKFHTNDGIARFHPNFYRNGKVCLSILNTWKGECWTSCQSIRSVLLTIVSLFENNALLHEPGIRKDNIEVQKYNEIIEYVNLQYAHFKTSRNVENGMFRMFKHIIQKHLSDNSKFVLKLLAERSKTNSQTKTMYCKVYNFSICLDYFKLYLSYEKYIPKN